MEISNVQTWISGDYKEYYTSRNYSNDVTVDGNGPDIRLKELEQQLERAETRCGSLKSQLDYMKMLYQGVQPGSSTEKQLMECPEAQTNLASQIPELESPIEKNDLNENNVMKDVKYYDFLKEIYKMKRIAKEDAESLKISPKQDSKSARVSPKVDNQYCSIIEKNEDSNLEHQCSRKTKTKSKIYTFLEPESTSAPIYTTASEDQEVCKEHDIDDATILQHPYQQHLIEYSMGLQEDITNTKELITYCPDKDQEEYTKQSQSSFRNEINKRALLLKFSENMDNAQTTKRKKSLKSDKKQRITAYSALSNKKMMVGKIDDTNSVMSKVKRKRGKLRSANSKSTVATKDTNLSDRKDSKKRKHKGFGATSRILSLQQRHTFLMKTPQNQSELVDIYHNNAAESGTISMASSKHSKPDPQIQDSQYCDLTLKNDLKSMEEPTYVQEHELQQQLSLQNQKIRYQILQKQHATESANHTTHTQDYPLGCSTDQNYRTEDYTVQQPPSRSVQSPLIYCDPTVIRNYELPTVSSKLKQVSRSYFDRFNFRNIPFVVGTSVTPSHNLGLNIQQVLSIMKTKHPATSGITPLLIRKVSKGDQPVFTLLNRINDQCQKSSQGIGSEFNESSFGRYNVLDKRIALRDRKGNVSMQASRTVNMHDTETYFNMQQAYMKSSSKNAYGPLYEEEEGTPSEMQWHQRRQQSRCTCCTKKSMSNNQMLKQFTSQKSIADNSKLTPSTLLKQQEDLNIGDGRYNKCQNEPNNSKGIREVLGNLHDQFEEMNAEYEKLQEQAEKSNNKSLTKQVETLEKKLNVKEDEINAVVGLYREVLALKQQIKMLHKGNSFVCITTKASTNPIISHSPISIRTQAANPLQIFGVRRNSPSSAREPPTATRLVALLRQIQTFQKQLKFTS